jgi:thymidylate synthase (FAD)
MKMAEINVDYIGGYGSDNTVVDAARVSMHKDASNYTGEQNEKLISYLSRNGHTSPFNHAFLSFRVKAPIFVARQLVKHKFMPWNEVSRRYVDEEPEFYIPESFRRRAENIKQGSSDISFIPESMWSYLDGVEDVHENCDEAVRLYTHLLKEGVAPEQARMVLPQNTMTEWVWSGTLGAFLDMLKLRLDPHTQYESRIVAQKIASKVQELFPISYKYRIEND